MEREVPSSYTDLTVYRTCPRLFGFRRLGYKPVTINEPMTTGQLTHAGISAYFRGQAAAEAINRVAGEYQATLDRFDRADKWENEEKLDLAEKRAKELTARYIKSWAKDYKAVLVEPVLELHGAICHPDLIAFYGMPKEQRVIVDFKTSYHPDERWYDISNQADLYAYVFTEKTSHRYIQLVYKQPISSREQPIFRREPAEVVDLIVYDTISEEGIYRHMRPPRLAAGKQLFGAVQVLDKQVKAQIDFLADPHHDWTCPTRCSYFHPCWLLDTDSWEAAHDYLSENYLLDK